MAQTQTRTPYRAGMIWSSLFILAMLALSAYAWVRIPAGAQLAIHWGIDGQPDGYGGKMQALLIFPIIALGVTLLVLILARLEPRQQHIRNSARAYATIIAGLLGMLTIMHGFIIATALGMKINIAMVLPPALGFFFLMLGNYMGKLSSNFTAGIRTSWTLSSELSWNKTHRFGGKMFMLVGLVLILGMLLQEMPLFFILLMGELLGVAVLLSVYSYFIWKLDPARTGIAVQGDIERTPAVRWTAVMTYIYTIGLFAVLLAVAHWPSSAPQVDVEARAVQMVEAMAAGNFTEAEQYFDARMRTSLPPAQLQGIWTGLVSQYGPYERVAGTRIASRWPYTQVMTDVKFTRATVTMRIVFSKDGSISGLWLAGVK